METPTRGHSDPPSRKSPRVDSGNRGRVLVTNLLLVAAASGFAFIVGEIGVRLLLDVPHPYRHGGSSSGDFVFGELRTRTLNKYVPYRYEESVRTVFPDPSILHGLPDRLTFTVDQFGFRSTRPVSIEKPDGQTRIIAIGGSTTECKDLDDSQAWPELLSQLLAMERPGTEVINAGFAGDSSRDHIALLAQQLVAFEPDVALFLVGINDLELQLKPDYSIVREDRRSQFQQNPPSPGIMVKAWGSDISHLVRLMVWAIRKYATTDSQGNPVQDLKGQWVADQRKRRQMQPMRSIDTDQWPSEEYVQNIRTLVGISRANQIEPIFVTQPVIWGAAPGKWEELLWVSPHPDYKISHQELWEVMERFNDVLRTVAKQEGLILVDLAQVLPKTTDVFWDDDHYTIAGSQQVAEIIASELGRREWADRLRD